MKSSPNPGAVSPPLPSPAESAGGVAIMTAASDPRALAHDKAIEAALNAWIKTPKSLSDIETAMRAAIAAYEAALWQPVAEHKSKGIHDEVLTYRGTDLTAVAVKFTSGWCVADGCDIENVTHWRPLPTAPKGTASNE